MNIGLAFSAIDVAAVVCSALLCARLLLRWRTRRVELLLALIAFNTIWAVTLSHAEYGGWLDSAFRLEIPAPAAALMNLLRNSTAAVFMLACHALFADRPFPRWLAPLIVVQLALEGPLKWLLPGELPRLLGEVAPSLLQTLFIVMALYWTAATWKSDLVQQRRLERLFVMFVVGFDIGASNLLLRVVIPQGSIANYYAFVALTALGAAITIYVLFYYMGDAPPHGFLAPEQRRAPAPAPAESPELARLRGLLEQERVYLQPGLTLKELGDLVGLPEYRMRKLIHEQLGHRNFNVFLHSYRIREACKQLRDPAMRRTPILTIALSVGYQSANTFNRAFREIMGVTPSEYRDGEASGAAQSPPLAAPETE
jgi:AraC-like DNA-binding protein